jgi:hypothetical protein
MRNAERRERQAHVAEAGRFNDAVAEYVEAFGEHTREQLMEVVRTHNVEEAIAAAIRLLALRFHTTTVGDGPDAEFPDGCPGDVGRRRADGTRKRNRNAKV